MKILVYIFRGVVLWALCILASAAFYPPMLPFIAVSVAVIIGFLVVLALVIVGIDYREELKAIASAGWTYVVKQFAYIRFRTFELMLRGPDILQEAIRKWLR